MARMDQSRNGSGRSRGSRATSAMVASILAIGAATGCNDDEALRAWRDAALPSLETGLKAILDGVVTGAFAAASAGTSDMTADSGAAGAGDATGG